jgi:hypothetical protein
MGSNSQLNANASGGSGTYSYAWASNPAGFTSTIANPIVTPLQNTVYSVLVTNSGETLGNSVTVSVFPGPAVSAGANSTICEGSVVQLDGNATNFQSVLWTSSGDGVFTNPATQDTDYTPGPGDITSGSVTLTLTAQPVGPCIVSVSANKQLTISGLPQVNAGNNQTVCENVLVQLAPSVNNYSTLQWTTSGDGVFNNPSLPNAVYTPGAGDLTNGNVDLEIVLNPIAPCTGIVTDFVSVTLIPLPSVNAGSNIIICQDDVAQLNGIVTNFQSVLWVSTGDGIFGDATLLNTTYTPGINDLQTGGATLSLIAQPTTPCIAVITDNLTLSIVKLPLANAGIDATVCEDDTHQLNASATNYEEVIWSTSGNGVFGDPNSLSTTYTPGTDDIIAGEVVLILTAMPEFPCAVNANDELQLSVLNLPNLNAGSDGSVCLDNAFQLNASAVNYNTVTWSTSGDGLFADPNSLITTYVPGANDVLTGNVELAITATSLFPCVTSVNDNLNLSIIGLPEVVAGDDATICQDGAFQLDGQASNFLITQWITSGDGAFNNILIFNPVYTPGPEDILSGSVELSLTAIPISPCTEMQQSDLSLTITPVPIADAGPDATVPKDDVHQLEGMAVNYSSLLWTTSGDGEFSDTGILDPFYTPGEQDISSTLVTLTLTASPLSPCVVASIDDMYLEIDTLVGIQQIIRSYSLVVFPNPTSGRLKINVPARATDKSCSLKVFTLTGELLFEEILDRELQKEEQLVPLNIAILPDGVYLIQLISGSTIWQSKIILKKE